MHLFAAHSWMEQLSESGQEQYDQDGFGCEGLDNGGCSFSTQCISREQDYSFSVGQLEQSTDNECKSSFSSFLPVDNTLPNSGFGGFSFDGKQPESTSACFSSTGIPSMPSFTFFSPIPATTQNNNISETDGKVRGTSFTFPWLRMLGLDDC